MRSLRYESLASKNIKRLDHSIQQQVEEEIASILKDPFSSSKGKPLTGNLKGKYRWRFGDYRVLYEISDKHLTIFLISHRKDVYKIDARFLQLLLSL